MKYPTLRFVFDRKHQATKEKTALIQIEVQSEKKKKYISTGIKVYAGQWKDKYHIINRNDMMELNQSLEIRMKNIRAFINSLIEKHESFEFGKLERFLNSSAQSSSFIDFVEDRISKRSMRKSTKRTHQTLLSVLLDFNKIVYFTDVTTSNIKLFDDYLHSKKLSQPTIASYHKRLKIYINEAIVLEKLERSPYTGIKIDRGESKKRKYLTLEELEEIENCKIDNESICQVRDCFLFQCYTGLAYADLLAFDYKRDVEKYKDKFIIKSDRLKTGTFFIIVLLPKPLEIIKKYNYRLPVISNQQYNMRLKVMACYAKIDKEITSHMARHTFATLSLSKGMRIENVSKALGHTNIKTTQIYSKILSEDVIKDFDKLK